MGEAINAFASLVSDCATHTSDPLVGPVSNLVSQPAAQLNEIDRKSVAVLVFW
jgi:hypothetical protein